MKVSDYVAQFLVENGIRDLFLISGGGMMHLLDSVGKKPDLNLIFNLNEQATGICAESYGQYNNKLGACMVTTGPGGTNAITGCAAAWLDSTPVIYISGQTKTADMGQLKGLRFYGAQEVAIVPTVTPITKYAQIIKTKEDVRYHLEKAVYYAQHGRRGPVWLDIPLDIQGSQIDPNTLRGFDPSQDEELAASAAPPAESTINNVYSLINHSKRPVILMGHGVVADDAGDTLRSLAEKLNIPVLATWRAKGIFGDDEPLFMGYPGIPAPRYSNYVLQNSDLLIIVGTRLNSVITAYQEENFAPLAKKIIVDIDPKEIEKLTMPFALRITSTAKQFLSALHNNIHQAIAIDRTEWLSYCVAMRNKYPVCAEIQPWYNENKVDGYYFAEQLSNYSKVDDVFVGSSSGRTCGISHMAYKVKKGQKFISSMGLGSMGWCLPSAISCCVASERKRTITLEGDGSLQHNIQELALINSYHLPIKLFVWSNNGYASIYGMQKNNFESCFYGCDPTCGLEFPNLKSIAKAYDLPYYLIESNSQIISTLDTIMKDNEPAICEIIGSINFDEIPKSMTIAKPDGTFESSKLDNLYPFLSKGEQAENMPNWK